MTSNTQTNPLPKWGAETAPVVIAAMYHFAEWPDHAKFQASIKQVMLENGIMGTLLLTPEGMNGTVAGTRAAIDTLLAFLKQDTRFAALKHKEAYAAEMPFPRAKVRLKKETITMHRRANPSEGVGTYLQAQEWNEIISNPDVVVVDTRNDYEVRVGTFKNAYNPVIDTFQELGDWVEKNLDPAKHKKVAMFCTGGIRCEKSTAYMLNQGFEEVYHLEGGILKYLEEVPPEESLWDGECYVFDGRIAVGHGLKPTETVSHCPECGGALFAEGATPVEAPIFDPSDLKDHTVCRVCEGWCGPRKRERIQRRPYGPSQLSEG